MSSIFPQRPTAHYRRVSSTENPHRQLNGKTSSSPTRQPRNSDSPSRQPKSPLSPFHSHSHHAPSIAPRSRSHTTPLPVTSPVPPSPLTRPPITPRAYSMMYNNPYQWGGAQGGNGMMPGGYNPYMMMGGGSQAGSTMNGPTAGGSAAGTISARGGAPSEGGMQAFDSSKMKQGRMGHYGYLEGRELAGPPVGFLPAGVQPEQYDSPAAPSNNQISPSHRAASTAGQSYYTAPPSQGGGGSVNGSMAWGDSGNTPRARYDGSSTAAGYVQADLDTPYPRTNGGGASSAFTRYGPDGSIVNGIDGRMGINHRRLREGRV
ncbi:hypothetical protein I302_102547 [Kwoniella bestiolae CBS 10118]|uniref:Uncharacterized protein n=1 Tax=Kwoniella bestiolae CBS 10118 TaxID=1296100 RepID=A0AAJ8M6U7_9TREE